jgi:hypothetical protein
LDPALNHENYETNPKQFLRIVFKCSGFAQFGRFFAGEKKPKLPATCQKETSPGSFRAKARWET